MYSHLPTIPAPPRPSTKRLAAALFLLALIATPPARAVNKDMVELQTQIQGLQDAVARLQQSNDERMGVLRDLTQQNADSINKMSVVIDSLSKLMRTQQEATGGKLDQVSGQVQSLNDSVDEIKARLNRLEKALQSVQEQQQSINAGLQNLAPGVGGTGAPAPAGTLPPTSSETPAPAQQPPIVNRRGKPTADVPLASAAPAGPTASVSASPASPPAADLYKTALSDYMAAKAPLAASEFGDVIRLYPDNSLSGNAFYYLGEIDFHAAKYSTAVKDYDHVLEQFPDNPKVPAAHLHKGNALFALKQNDAGVREMRALITRFPNSPEATQARTKLSGMGVPVTPRAH